MPFQDDESAALPSLVDGSDVALPSTIPDIDPLIRPPLDTDVEWDSTVRNALPDDVEDFGPPLQSLENDDWDPHALLEALDQDMASSGLVLDISLGSELVPAPPTKKPKPKPKRNYDPNKSRNQRPHEIKRLQAEVAALELKLQQLQLANNNNNNNNNNNSSSTRIKRNKSGPSSHARPPKLWQAICSRQLERRLQAEQENCRLRKRLKVEYKLAKSVEKLLFKRQSMLGASRPEAGKRVRRVEIPAGFISHVAAQIFDELAAGVDVAYREVERVLAPKGHDSDGVEIHKLPLREGASVELFDGRVLPFSPRAIGDAWWSRWQSYRGQRAAEPADVEVVRERYGLEMINAKTEKCGTFYAQQVLRRYVQDDRVVIVWRAYFEPLLFENELVCGVHFLLKGCVRMTPLGSAEDGETATRVQTCYTITPRCSDPQLQKSAATEALTNFVVKAQSAYISAGNAAMEDLLVGQALQTCH